MHIHWGAFKSFYIFVHIRDSIGLVSAIAKQQAINKSAIQHDVIVDFGFPGNTASDFLFNLCLLYVGGSQSSSDANNQGLQTQQCPGGQVAGNPCRGRFNSERTVTWTSARAAKKKTSPLIERLI